MVNGTNELAYKGVTAKTPPNLVQVKGAPTTRKACERIRKERIIKAFPGATITPGKDGLRATRYP